MNVLIALGIAELSVLVLLTVAFVVAALRARRKK